MTTSDPAASSSTPAASRVLAKFHWDCGRMGDVDGMFVTTREALNAAYGKQVYFGEILGKHSEVYGPLEEGDVTIVTDDQSFIDKLVEYVGTNVSGYNPLSYLQEEGE